jgi:hypothetical protein
VRAVLTMATNGGYLTDKAFRFSNMPVFADNIDDPDCVYPARRNRKEVAPPLRR